MTPAQRRAMLCGLELESLNRVRAARAEIVRVSHWDGRWHGSVSAFTPAALAGYLMGTAIIDQRRRELRLLLRDCLEDIAPPPPRGSRGQFVQEGSPQYWREMHARLFGPGQPGGRHAR